MLTTALHVADIVTAVCSRIMHAEHAYLHLSQPPDASTGAHSHQAATHPVLLAGQLGLQAHVLLLPASCCNTSCSACRFELAVQLGELEVALDIAENADSEGKWRQLSELAMSTGKLEVSSSFSCPAAGYWLPSHGDWNPQGGPLLHESKPT